MWSQTPSLPRSHTLSPVSTSAMSMKWSSDAEASIFPSWLKLRVRTGQSSLQTPAHHSKINRREKKEKQSITTEHSHDGILRRAKSAFHTCKQPWGAVSEACIDFHKEGYWFYSTFSSPTLHNYSNVSYGFYRKQCMTGVQKQKCGICKSL